MIDASRRSESPPTDFPAAARHRGLRVTAAARYRGLAARHIMYRIAVVGAGGVGGFFGGRLALLPDVDVIFLLRKGEHADAIMSNGLSVDSEACTPFHVHLKVALRAEDIGPCDAVIVCVKAYSLEAIAPTLKPLMRATDSPTLVLPLLNGISAPKILTSALGAQHCVGGLCKVFAWISKPGVITQRGSNHDITFGELDGSASARVDRLAAVLTRAGIPHLVPAPEAGGVQTAIWEKFGAIVALSGVGAATRATLGEILAEPRTLALFQQVLLEGWAVGTAHGATGLSEAKATKLVGYLRTLPGRGTASMQRDMMEGKISELHAQLGAMVESAQAKGVSTPAISLLYAALLPQERAAEVRAATSSASSGSGRGSGSGTDGAGNLSGRRALLVGVVVGGAAMAALLLSMQGARGLRRHA